MQFSITNRFNVRGRFGGRSWVTIIGCLSDLESIPELGISTTTIIHNKHGYWIEISLYIDRSIHFRATNQSTILIISQVIQLRSLTIVLKP